MNDQPNQPKPSSNKFFDVLPPGRAPAPPNSRPLILNDQNLQTDTMLTKPADKFASFAAQSKIPARNTPKPEPQQQTITPDSNVSSSVSSGSPMPTNSLSATSQFVIVHHSKPAHAKRSIIILMIFFVIVLAVLIDLLLDAQIIKSSLPHTHFLN